MADAMVTGRMTSAKKEAGNRVLDGLGLNASQAINQLYDHLIEQGSMPCVKPQSQKAYSKGQVEEALSYVRSLQMPKVPRELAGMTDDEVKRHKMRHRYGIETSGA